MTERSALALVSFDDVPAGDGWLGPRERSALGGHMTDRRREAWRAGRWAARQALAKLPGIDAAHVEILAATDGAPEAWNAGGQRMPVNVSISHRGRRAAALATPAGVVPGCDLELVEPHSAGFVSDWFTASERAQVEAAGPDGRDLLIALIWSAKESALKVLREGLRVDTRQVEVSLAGDTFQATVDEAPIRGWWTRDGPFVLTAALQEKTQ